MTDVDYGRLRSITARELVRALARDGFHMERQSGSHRQYYHPDGRSQTDEARRTKGYCFVPPFRRHFYSQAASDYDWRLGEVDQRRATKARLIQIDSSIKTDKIYGLGASAQKVHDRVPVEPPTALALI